VSAPLLSRDAWPSLPYDELRPTVDHLHRLVQIGGKYTLDQPFEFNWGNIVLSVTPRGFSTPTLDAGDVLFTVDYELLDDRVTVTASTGRVSLPLGPGTVADFYESFVEAVAPLGIPPLKTTVEPEIPNAPTLDNDREQRPYDSEAVRRVWSAFASAERALTVWQAAYRGHRPPVGIMWGGFDLSATRYTGRAVTPPDTMPVFQQNGMAGEVVALGFFLGDDESRAAAFYAYISPSPPGIDAVDFGVDGATYLPEAGLIVLPWDIVRARDDPQETVVRFADGVYHAAIELGGWPANLTGPRHEGWYASTHRVVAE
jgi:hypothetical protein